MRPSSTLCLLGLFAAGFSSLLGKGPEVLVAADALVAPEGFRPTPGKPIHYLLSQVPLSLGESTAGIKLPPSALIEQAVVAELAKQGFVRTGVGGPLPAIVIVATYGASNFRAPDDAEDLEMYRAMVQRRPMMTEAEVTMEAQRLKYISSPRFRDRGGVGAITGIEKVIGTASMNTANASKIAAAANDDRLYITLAALDAALFAKKEKKLLWRTSMSIDWRSDFADNLPVMLASAGPLFGTDVKAPVFLDDRERRNFDVKIGEATEVAEPSKSAPSPSRGR